MAAELLAVKAVQTKVGKSNNKRILPFNINVTSYFHITQEISGNGRKYCICPIRFEYVNDVSNVKQTCKLQARGKKLPAT